MTDAELAELKRANDLKEREVFALETIAAKRRPRNALETISKWWAKEKAATMRRNYD